MKYEIDDITHKNLITFLSRVNLTGAEVSAFNNVLTSLSSPVMEKELSKEEQK